MDLEDPNNQPGVPPQVGSVIRPGSSVPQQPPTPKAEIPKTLKTPESSARVVNIPITPARTTPTPVAVQLAPQARPAEPPPEPEISRPSAQPQQLAPLPGAYNHPLFKTTGRGFTPPPQPAETKPPPRPRRWKKTLILFGLSLLVLGGSAAAYFGYFVPNKPENVWTSALENTGKGYDKLTQYVNSRKSTAGTSVKGTIELAGRVSASGTFSGTSSGGSSELTGVLSAGGVKVNLDVRMIKSIVITPDVYFNANGLKSLATPFSGSYPAFASALNGLNNQWYFISHNFFDQFAADVNLPAQITSGDISSFLTAVGNPSHQYLFTSDNKKMAFSVQKFVGKERQDGRRVYHYKVGINKSNLINYVSALCSDLKAGKLTKFFSNNPALKQQLGCNNTPKTIGQLDVNQSADVWVDLSTKLIHKVRLTNKSDQNDYLDIGQNYTGGNKFPLTLELHRKSSNTTTVTSLQLTLDSSNNFVDVKTSVQKSGKTSQTVTLDMTLSPTDSTIKVERPDQVKSSVELLKSFGLPASFASSAAGTSGTSSVTTGGSSAPGSQSLDTQRQNSINAIAAQLEAYFAKNGRYPTFDQLNDASWRAANIPGLSSDTLKDPRATSSQLATAPAANIYSYQPTPTGCDNGQGWDCEDYTLTATLDSGGTYVKQSANTTSI